MNTLILFLIKEAFGLKAFYFHLYSVALHAANTVILYNIILILFSGKEQCKHISFLIAFLFLFHPLQIEAVAWISASKWLLVTFFMLLSVLFYLQYTIHSNSGCFVYSFLFFFLAFLSKEVSVVLPLLLLVIEIFFLKRGFFAMRILLPYFGFSLIFGIVTLQFPIFQPDMQQLRIEGTFNFVDNIVFSFGCLADYFFYLIIPIHRGWALGLITGQENMLPTASAVVVIIFCVGLYYFTDDIKLMGCFLFFVTSVFFTLPIFPAIKTCLIADRYVYFAGIGIWSSLIYMLHDKNNYIKALLYSYMLYLVIFDLIETGKWYNVL
ncbi:hypothetical protein QTN47_03640 [Danxiaibacter flavus]|uniref:Glycosyltransferase RgtA/B/C/D-like domain-containing protein n=1 Tax=Danxiaibacter flavus TaxID=3049108 RepID=A0ABV3ZAE4_9BACT|nr:hypothetical protein QNM32_03640 [Chitinophagaceae bacterium DXS]